MNHLNTFFFQIQPPVIIGALAFVITAIHVVLSYPVYLRMIFPRRHTGKGLPRLFFILGIGKHVSWLLYLWPLDNLFVSIGLCLEILTTLILVIQTLWPLEKDK